MPQAGQPGISDDYLNYLTLCAHEYFHTWHVKRIKPAAFMPYDLTQEVYTEQLWAFEGFTSYYEILIPARAGLISMEQCLTYLARKLSRVYKFPGRYQQSVTDSSFSAWTKFYKQDENSPNAIVSYYNKGALIALALDLLMRQRSTHQYSLDSLMQQLWQHYGQPGIGVPEQGIAQLLAQHCPGDWTDFLDQALYQCTDLPLQDLLAQQGVELGFGYSTGFNQFGGSIDQVHTQPGSVLGARVAPHPVGAKLTCVLHEGAAQRAGLSAGDIVIAVQGIQARADTLDNMINAYPIGQRLTLHAFRRDELMTFTLTTQAAVADTCYLRIVDRQRCNQWLQLPTTDPTA